MGFINHLEGSRDAFEFDAGKHAPPVVSYFQVTFFPGFLNLFKMAKIATNTFTHLRVEQAAIATYLSINAIAKAGVQGSDETRYLFYEVNPLDFRFSKVSGLSSTIETDTISEGGFNNETLNLPSRVSHDNLVLERGYVDPKMSITSAEASVAFNTFTHIPGDILIVLNSPDGDLVDAWLYRNTFLVGWSNSDLESDENDIFREKMEFAYSHRIQLKLY